MITLPPDYRPTDSEEFMNSLQVEYFRQKLLRWKSDLLREAGGTLASLSEGGIHEADIGLPGSSQRAFEAVSKVIKVVDDMLGTLLALKQ